MNEELLRECFNRLRSNAAAGIDKAAKGMYAENLDANLTELIGRLHRMAYIPQPVRRTYISKPGSSKQRPLGRGLRVLKTNLSRQGLYGYWNKCTSRIS